MSVVDRTLTEKEFISQPDDDLLVCRCEEITKGEIRRAIHDGIFTMTEMRRYLRACMGLCQGQTCSKNVKTIIARELGLSPLAVEYATARSPMRPIEMYILANEEAGR
jgi:NAD(P)H-nitrite reductase large subunit